MSCRIALRLRSRVVLVYYVSGLRFLSRTRALGYLERCEGMHRSDASAYLDSLPTETV
jgi:hypothetical protein